MVAERSTIYSAMKAQWPSEGGLPHWVFLPNSVKSKKYKTFNRSPGRDEHSSGMVQAYLRENRSKNAL